MYERFTDRARRVMERAAREARRLNHLHIGSEHILLGLVKEDTGVAANVLKNLDVNPHKVRVEIEKVVQAGPDKVTPGKRPHGPEADRVIGHAAEEARNFDHQYVGTEHLLVGLLREQEGVAARVLVKFGLKLEDVREEVLALLGQHMATEEGSSAAEDDQAAVDQDAARDVPSELQDHPLVERLCRMIEDLFDQKLACVAEQDFEQAVHARDHELALRQSLRQIVEVLKHHPTLGREAEDPNGHSELG
jgi:ATP-dependent Clp protease ATP-binding subunit ClpC